MFFNHPQRRRSLLSSRWRWRMCWLPPTEIWLKTQSIFSSTSKSKRYEVVTVLIFEVWFPVSQNTVNVLPVSRPTSTNQNSSAQEIWETSEVIWSGVISPDRSTLHLSVSSDLSFNMAVSFCFLVLLQGVADPEEAPRAAGVTFPGLSCCSSGHRHQSQEVRHVRHDVHQKDQHEESGVQRSEALTWFSGN